MKIVFDGCFWGIPVNKLNSMSEMDLDRILNSKIIEKILNDYGNKDLENLSAAFDAALTYKINELSPVSSNDWKIRSVV